MTSFQSISVRIRKPLFLTSVSLAGFGIVVYVWLGVTDNSSDGSARFVILPLLIAGFFLFSGIYWFWSDRPVEGVRLCLGCGYDLRGHEPDVATCPECGDDPKSRNALAELRRDIVAKLIGVPLILLGLLFLGWGLFYFVLWKGGALGAI